MPASAAKVVQLSERTRDPYRVTEPRTRNARPPRQRQQAPTARARALRDIPVKQRQCRVRHPWPTENTMQYGKPLPRGVWIENDDYGSVLVEACPRCGKKRRQAMLSGRSIDPHAGYGYTDPQDWVTADETLDAGRRACRHDLINSALRAGS